MVGEIKGENLSGDVQVIFQLTGLRFSFWERLKL